MKHQTLSSGLRDQAWGSRKKITTWRTSIIVRSFTRIISDFRVHPTLSDFWKCSIHFVSKVSYCINKRNKTDINKVKFVLHSCWCHYDEILSILVSSNFAEITTELAKNSLLVYNHKIRSIRRACYWPVKCHTCV